MNKKNILVITQIYPSGNTGTSVKTRETIELLLKDYDVDVCCLHHKKMVKVPFKRKGLNVCVVEKNIVSKYELSYVFRMFFSLIGIKPFRVKKMFDFKLAELIKSLIKKKKYKYVLFDGFSTMQYMPYTIGEKIYVDDEDIVRLMKRRAKDSESFLLKTFFWIEYLRCLYYEKKWLCKFDRVWAISPESLDRMSEVYKKTMSLMPTIVPRQKNVFSVKSQNIVFVGLLSWMENIEGLRWFLANCWGEINKKGDRSLKIVGQMADYRVESLVKKHDGVELVGYAKNLNRIFRNTALAIAPIKINCGIKVKILTYLSYGVPVVALGVSVGGMKTSKGVVKSGNDKEFVDNVKKLLNDNQLRKKLSSEGYKNIEKNHSKTTLRQFFLEQKVLD